MRIPLRISASIVLVPIAGLALTAIVWRAVAAQDERRILDAVAAQSSRVEFEIRTRLQGVVESFERVTYRWAVLDEVLEADLFTEGNILLLREPGLEALVLLGPDFEQRWTAAAGNPIPARDWDFSAEPAARRAWAEATRLERGLVSATMVAPDTDRVVLVSVPVVTSRGLDGLLVGAYDLRTLLRARLSNRGRDYGVSVSDGTETMLDPLEREGDLSGQWGHETELVIDHLTLTARVWPTEVTLATLRSALPRSTIVGGVLLSVILVFAIRLGQVEGLRAKESEMTHDLQREVNARGLAELSLQRRAAALEQSNADLERFAYAVSHDLKEPLNAIGIYLQMLQDDVASDGQARYVDTATRSVVRMKEMIHALLEYSRIGGSADEPEPLDADDVVREAIANLDAAISRTGASVRVPRLPRVIGHRALLVQLFQNLIGNAIRYRADRTPEITIEVDHTETEWRFAVRDNGIGIPEDHHERVFGLFFSMTHAKPADPSPGDGESTGIGLAVCKRIVERHGGQISVESTPGQGAVFRFSLATRPSIP